MRKTIRLSLHKESFIKENSGTKTIKEMSEILGVGRWTVQMFMIQHGIPPKNPHLSKGRRNDNPEFFNVHECGLNTWLI